MSQRAPQLHGPDFLEKSRAQEKSVQKRSVDNSPEACATRIKVDVYYFHWASYASSLRNSTRKQCIYSERAARYVL